VISVIDVSVAIKWFIPDGDRADASAERVLRRLVERPASYVVPELFIYELTAVLCRRLREARDVTRAMDRMQRFGIRRIPLDSKTLRRAVRIAFDHKLTGDDAAYAALAIELGGQWLTFDEAAANRLAGLDVCRIPE
jgi:predicted nucleic acid-binding protein